MSDDVIKSLLRSKASPLRFKTVPCSLPKERVGSIRAQERRDWIIGIFDFSRQPGPPQKQESRMGCVEGHYKTGAIGSVLGPHAFTFRVLSEAKRNILIRSC